MLHQLINRVPSGTSWIRKIKLKISKEPIKTTTIHKSNLTFCPLFEGSFLSPKSINPPRPTPLPLPPEGVAEAPLPPDLEGVATDGGLKKLND